MALRGLKGGGYITHEQMERVGLTDADVAGKTQADVEVMMSGVQTSLPPVVSSLEEAAAFVKSKEFKSKITTDLPITYTDPAPPAPRENVMLSVKGIQQL